nr:hypothetical protein [uncultured Sphaerochaeta sp.]
MSNNKRYSYAGSDTFESFLGTTLQELGARIAQGFESHCQAVILGGGYGRGEGACVVHEGKERPYNDFDLFVVTDQAMEIPQAVHDVRKEYEKQLGIDVDIGKPLPYTSLANLPHTLMWQDLLDGHKVIYGEPDILMRTMSKSMMQPLPKTEAARLLLNRGSGLLQAMKEAQVKQSEDPDFIRRNYQKCALALGDALLISASVYKPPLSYRREQIGVLTQLPSPKIMELYQRAADFKVQPDDSHREPSLEDLKEMANLWVKVFLQTEKERTNRSWKDIYAYAKDGFIREPLQHQFPLLARNLVKQARLGKLSWRYPRERLYGMLGILLIEGKTESKLWQEKVDSFLRVWITCN